MSKLEFNNIGEEEIVISDEEVSIDGVNISKLVNRLKGINIFDEYIEEMLFSNFEGYNKNDVVGIIKLLKDMVIYVDNK